MHKNRPFLFTLLILLVLDLLVIFTEIPSSSKNRENTCFEQETEEVMEVLCEIREEIEEESELFYSGLLTSGQVRILFLHSCTQRLFCDAVADTASLAFGWRMPLLI